MHLVRNIRKKKELHFPMFFSEVHCIVRSLGSKRRVMGKETIEDLIISKLHSFFFFFQPGITTETFIKKRKKETEELLFLGKMAINITNNCNK